EIAKMVAKCEPIEGGAAEEDDDIGMELWPAISSDIIGFNHQDMRFNGRGYEDKFLVPFIQLMRMLRPDCFPAGAKLPVTEAPTMVPAIIPSVSIKPAEEKNERAKAFAVFLDKVHEYSDAGT